MRKIEIKGPEFTRETTGAKGHGSPLKVTIATHGEFELPAWLLDLLSEDDFKDLKEVLDHRRHVGSIAYTEPYGVSDKSLRALLSFCDKFALRFSIIGKSNNYPSETMRFVIWRPQDEEQLNNLCHWMIR
jgi:hypothetical protein